MARVKLTQHYIDNPPPVPEGKAKVEHCDTTALPGLFFEQRAVNDQWGTFRLRYKNAAGKTTYISIGRSCDITLAEARQKARKLKAEIQLGADPQAAHREKQKILTWDSFFASHYLPHVKQRKRSWANDEEMHRLRVSARFGAVALNRFTRRDVQQWMNELREEGLAPATCDHYAKLIRQGLNLAVHLELLDSNPVAGIKLFGGDNRVENVLTPDELQRLLGILNNPKERRETVSHVIKFLLFTGARVNEALHARWSDIDLTHRTWTVQATNSKSKRRRSIPLNDAAMALLAELGPKRRSEWLFNSRHGDGRGRMTTIDKVWQQIRAEAGLPSFRLHDLRHNFASMLVNSGRTLYEVQQILGHSDSKVTERYAHLSTKTLQEAANTASDSVNAALNPR
mgnify:FL=1